MKPSKGTTVPAKTLSARIREVRYRAEMYALVRLEQKHSLATCLLEAELADIELAKAKVNARLWRERTKLNMARTKLHNIRSAWQTCRQNNLRRDFNASVKKS